MRALLLSVALLGVPALVLAKPLIVPEPLIAACASKPVGAPCTVTFGGTTKSGACTKLPDDTVACMQARKPKK
jgi:hypothetical protein